jgi:hypothetical protein
LLLRARREWPRGGRAAEQRDELALSTPCEQTRLSAADRDCKRRHLRTRLMKGPMALAAGLPTIFQDREDVRPRACELPALPIRWDKHLKEKGK